MNYIAVFLIGIIAIGLISPSYAVQSSEYGTIRNKIYFSFLVAIMAFSPIFSLILSNYFRIRLSGYSLISFIWVGFSMSLPMSLLLARLGGRGHLLDFWKYLEESSRVKQRTLVMAWAAISVMLVVLGMILISA